MLLLESDSGQCLQSSAFLKLILIHKRTCSGSNTHCCYLHHHKTSCLSSSFTEVILMERCQHAQCTILISILEDIAYHIHDKFGICFFIAVQNSLSSCFSLTMCVLGKEVT